MVRQDRRRRRLEQENPESGNRRTRHTATYRPEDNDAVCPPPQYRSYALDQVYVEPEMSTVYPDEAHHLGHRRGLSESESMSSRQDLINDAGTTELYELSESTAEGSRQPTTAATTTTMTTATNSPPQSPSPQSITTPNAAEQDGEPSATSSNASTSTVSAPPRPRQTSISMVEQIGNIRPGIFEPILSRIRSRSLGPPPYIPTASEDALPRLPPEYATAVSD
ncbi:hypothetical protein BGZ58_003068 [Dissophora ornata]|nr:hypothetical protein BGZ58_003068 [Dissophora ornata]